MNTTLEIKKVQNGFVVTQDQKTFVYNNAEEVIAGQKEVIVQDLASLKNGDSYNIKIQTER